MLAKKADTKNPLLVGVSGCQGSGKSTMAEYLRLVWKWRYGLNAVVLSLDDFYLTRTGRLQLAAEIHPLLVTRGVPGTHDIILAQNTLDRLLDSNRQDAVAIPRFDKATDDREPLSNWDQIHTQADIVLIEGWCLGVGPQAEADLIPAINVLEAEEDQDGSWRRYVNDIIASDYVPLYDRIDQWVVLQAPSFECVYRWRLEQEDKLRVNSDPDDRVMSAEEIGRFIQHFQRLTEHGLRTLPQRAGWLFELDQERRICG
jgi:D-glycerate 3-kinase